MSVDIGINFRATSGYVTDGTNETYCLSDNYPTTRGGVTFGWTQGSLAGSDLQSGNDRRLAGINYSGSASLAVFRVDLPASGTYDIHLAIGSANGGLASTVLRIRDNGSVIATINQASTTAQHFTDAGGTDRLNTAWAANEVATSLTFATTQFEFDIGSDVVAFEGLAHLRLVQGATGGSTTDITSLKRLDPRKASRGGRVSKSSRFRRPA